MHTSISNGLPKLIEIALKSCSGVFRSVSHDREVCKPQNCTPSDETHWMLRFGWLLREHLGIKFTDNPDDTASISHVSSFPPSTVDKQALLGLGPRI